MMRLSELIQGLDAMTAVVAVRAPSGSACGDPQVARVVADSRRVRPGDAFCAIAGHDADGHRYVDKALAAGASVIFHQNPLPPAAAPCVQVADSRAALAHLAHRCLGDPSRSMTVIGVTGTNGKTTTTYLLEAILAAAGRGCGVLGTISYRIGDRRFDRVDTHVTTPGADELAEIFAAVRDAGAADVAMEVSSHALDQSRVDGIDFDAAIFTNLTGDHLDYHGTMDRYLAAKTLLFARLRPDAAAILNRDHAESETIAARCRAPVTWYGLSPAADVTARIARMGADGSHYTLSLGGQAFEVRSPLIGRHNVANSLGAAAAAWRVGIEPEAIVAGLERIRAVPGRLEPVTLPGRDDLPAVLVDYAHTDDALNNVLSALRPLAGGHRLICVFGCGGDRDRTKRPRMAAVAERWADRIVVTSDNPRTEEPESIIDQIMAGFSPKASAARCTDRRSAIGEAIARADAGDVVLIAGKGHEDYQVIGRQKIHFDDREVAAEALAARPTAPAREAGRR